MENQHRKIKGYRELDQAEIDLMNEIKAKGEELGELVQKLRNHGASHGEEGSPPSTSTLDQRWVSIGATHFQQGLMALTRAVAKPTFF